MIVSLTANTTMDQVMFIPKFVAGATIRTTQTVHSMGGKPTDAAWILGQYGVPSLALGLAAGAIGGKIEAMLRERGVSVDFVQALGESRMAVALVTGDDGAQTTITPNTLTVQPQHVAALLAKLDAALETATVLVTGGSLPEGMAVDFYADVVQRARAKGVPVVLDGKPDALRAALPHQPQYIKPNQEEMAGLYGKPIHTPEDALAAGRWVLETYGTASIISLGAGGAVAVLPHAAYRIPPIAIDVVSAVGAGDAVLAGVTWAVGLAQPIEEGLRMGIATATAVCLHPGTAMFHMEDAQRFLPEVQLLAL